MRATWRLPALVLATACGRGPVFIDPRVVQGDDGDDGDASTSIAATTGEPPPGCDLDSHEIDCDGDGIPDRDDPFPTDPDRPGRAAPDVIYVHSAATLSWLDPLDPVPVFINEFRFPEGPDGQVVDIAIDRFGVLYAISNAVLHVCDPTSATCWALGDLPANSLAMLPEGTIETDDDTLVALAGSTWTLGRLRGPELTLEEIAGVSPYESRGDIATAANGLTVFTSPSASGDVVVAIEAATGKLLGEVAVLPASTGLYGAAAANGSLWLFDQLGTMWVMDPTTGASAVVGIDPAGIWGAAAHPDLR
jgi:hypothetical protein